jgi:hypothetical protein
MRTLYLAAGILTVGLAACGYKNQGYNNEAAYNDEGASYNQGENYTADGNYATENAGNAAANAPANAVNAVTNNGY